MREKGEVDGVMSTMILEKYNIRDTKKLYSDINNKVLRGMEIITYNAIKRNKPEEVSHIKTETLDYICDTHFIFNPVKVFDEELNIWTVSVDEINIYGEGATIDTAVQNLLESIQEFESIYLERIDLFSQVESIEKQLYMRRIIRCEGNKEKLRKVLGL